MTLQPTKRRFSVEEYHRMAKAGILSEDDRVELIDGEIIEIMPLAFPELTMAVADILGAR